MRDKHAEISRAIALVRMDAKGQGVPCGGGWIPRSKKCSKDKARSTSAEARKRGAKKAREYNQLRGEVKASAGMKPRVKASKTDAVFIGKGARELDPASVEPIKKKLQELEGKGIPAFVSWGMGNDRLVAKDKKEGASVYRFANGKLTKDKEGLSEPGFNNVASHAMVDDYEYAIQNKAMINRQQAEKQKRDDERKAQEKLRQAKAEVEREQQTRAQKQTETIDTLAKQLKGTKKPISISVVGDDGRPSKRDIDATVYGEKLAIHTPIGFRQQGYAVTHLKTGQSVGTYSSLKDAKRAVVAIAATSGGDVDNAVIEAASGMKAGEKMRSAIKLVKDRTPSDFDIPSSLPSEFTTKGKKRKDSIGDRITSLLASL